MTNARAVRGGSVPNPIVGRLGLVRECEDLLMRAEDPRIFVVVPRPAQTRRFMGEDTPPSGGAGFNHEQAQRSAIGECVERYASASYSPETLVRESRAGLGESAIGFDDFHYYSSAQLGHPQFPFARFRDDAPYLWREGVSLTDGERCFVPACLVYLTYESEHDDLFTLAVSTGTACHTERDSARLLGLYEVVERDAFMLAWLRKLPLQRIVVQGDPWLASLYRRHFAGSGFRFHVFDMTTDFGIPSILCIAEVECDGRTMIGTGAASRLCEREAIAKAMLEASTTAMFARSLYRRDPAWRPEAGFANVRVFDDHVRLFCEPDMRTHLDFLLADAPTRSVPVATAQPMSPDEELSHCVSRLDARGYRTLAVDLTLPDIACAGLVCTKVFVPGLVPLGSIHGIQPLGSPRLHEVPPLLGLQPGISDINPIPHPFP